MGPIRAANPRTVCSNGPGHRPGSGRSGARPCGRTHAEPLGKIHGCRVARRDGHDRGSKEEPPRCTSSPTTRSKNSSVSPPGDRRLAAGVGFGGSSRPRPASPPPRSPRPWAAPRAPTKSGSRRYNDDGGALADRPEHDRLRERTEAGPIPEDGACAFPNPRRPPHPRRRVRRRSGRTGRLRPAPPAGPQFLDAPTDPPQGRPQGPDGLQKNRVAGPG